jgi:hypothetical protein
MTGHFTRSDVLKVLPALLGAATRLATTSEGEEMLRAAATSSEDAVMAILNAEQQSAVVQAGFSAERFADIETIYSDFRGDRGERGQNFFHAGINSSPLPTARSRAEVMALLSRVVACEETVVQYAMDRAAGRLPEGAIRDGLAHECPAGAAPPARSMQSPGPQGRDGAPSAPAPKSMQM